MALSVSLIAPIPPPLERMSLPPGLRASSESSANRLRSKSERLIHQRKPLEPSAAGKGTAPAMDAADGDVCVPVAFSNEQRGGSSAAVAPAAHTMKPSDPNKACRFFASGRCRNGVACTFRHDAKPESKLAEFSEQLSSSAQVPRTVSASRHYSHGASKADKGQLFRAAVRKVSGASEAGNGTGNGKTAGGRPCEATPSAVTHFDRTGVVSTPSTAATVVPAPIVATPSTSAKQSSAKTTRAIVKTPAIDAAQRTSWGSRVDCKDPVEVELPYLPWAKGSPLVSDGSPLVSVSAVDEEEEAMLPPRGGGGTAAVEEVSEAKETARVWATPVMVPPVAKAAEWDTPIAEEATKELTTAEGPQVASEAPSESVVGRVPSKTIAHSSTTATHIRGCWRAPRREGKQPATSDVPPEALTMHQVHLLLLEGMYAALEREALRSRQLLD